MMASVYDLRTQRRDLLNQLDEIEDAMAEVVPVLEGITEPIPEELIEHYKQRGWLQRQQAGLLVVLQETERALLELGTEDWDTV